MTLGRPRSTVIGARRHPHQGDLHPKSRLNVPHQRSRLRDRRRRRRRLGDPHRERQMTVQRLNTQLGRRHRSSHPDDLRRASRLGDLRRASRLGDLRRDNQDRERLRCSSRDCRPRDSHPPDGVHQRSNRPEDSRRSIPLDGFSRST